MSPGVKKANLPRPLGVILMKSAYVVPGWGTRGVPVAVPGWGTKGLPVAAPEVEVDACSSVAAGLGPTGVLAVLLLRSF